MSQDLVDKMESILNAWRSSGETLLEFSKKSEFSYGKLGYWKRRLDPTKKHRMKTAEPSMVPVKIEPGRPVKTSPTTLEVILPNDIKLAVGDGFDATEARRLIEVLRSC